jgi:hypothetical protein
MCHILDLKFLIHEKLQRKYGVRRVNDRLSFDRQANQTLSVFWECDHERSCLRILRVLNHTGCLALPNRRK